jgi:hypothetical protein
MHAIWELPEGDGDCATRWMLIKSGFSRGIPKGEWVRESRQKKGERGIWQRRFWEHLITSERGPAKTYGLRAFQSGQTWIREVRFGLALQFDTPRYPVRMDVRGLGSGCECVCGSGREVKMLRFALLTPAYYIVQIKFSDKVF